MVTTPPGADIPLPDFTAAVPPPDPAPVSPPGPQDVYCIFCGNIEQLTAQKVVGSLTTAMVMKVQRIHLLFQTAGGYVGDGVFLYNLFRRIPIEITLYNAGQISSVGVVAYLGAPHRITSKSATFMIHRSTKSPQVATSTQLGHAAKTLVLDDQRTEEIIRNHANFPSKFWRTLHHHDLYFTGEEAVKFGIADAIGEFSPPAGTQVYNILG